MSQEEKTGDIIRRIRKSHRLSLQALADKIGVSFGYLGQVERNEKKANAEIYAGLWRELGVNLAGFHSEQQQDIPVAADSWQVIYCQSTTMKGTDVDPQKFNAASIEEVELLEQWRKLDEGKKKSVLDILRGLAECRREERK